MSRAASPRKMIGYKYRTIISLTLAKLTTTMSNKEKKKFKEELKKDNEIFCQSRRRW